MLQSDLGAIDLPSFRLTSQLPHQLGTLRETSRPERMPFRKEPARGVRDELSAVGVVTDMRWIVLLFAL